MSKKRNFITEKEFDKIKKLQAVGLKISEVASLLGRAHRTVRKVFNTESFGTFHKSKVAKVKTSKQGAVDNDLVRILRNTNDYLKSLDDRMKWLEEHVPITTGRKFLNK